MASVSLTGIGDLIGIPKCLSVGIEQAINRVHVPAGMERFGVKRLKQQITLLMSFFARAFALEQPVVFDYIECFHNPRMQHRLDAKDQAFRLLTQPSVETG